MCTNIPSERSWFTTTLPPSHSTHPPSKPYPHNHIHTRFVGGDLSDVVKLLDDACTTLGVPSSTTGSLDALERFTQLIEFKAPGAMGLTGMLRELTPWFANRERRRERGGG